MKGRKPRPTVLKLVTNNPGRRPINDKEPTPPVEIPEAPAFLEAEALAEWQRLTPLLREIGLISKLDRALVSSYCQAWKTYFECQTMLKQTGLIVKSPNGMPIYSPYYTMANQAGETMRKIAEQLGLSPSARSRVKAGNAAASNDPGENFLSGRKKK